MFHQEYFTAEGEVWFIRAMKGNNEIDIEVDDTLPMSLKDAYNLGHELQLIAKAMGFKAER
jgi:hypothetical protein